MRPKKLTMKQVILVERRCYVCEKTFKIPEGDEVLYCDECLPGEINKFNQAFERKKVPLPYQGEGP